MFKKLKLSQREVGLTRSFLLIRITLYFFTVPLLRMIFPRSPLVPFSADTEGLYGRLWKNLFVFDAAQLGYPAMDGGYFSELNHAFYPMFPTIAYQFAKLFGDEHLMYVGLVLSLLQSYVNTLLIYRIGVLMYGKRDLAELAAYLYIASHSVLYQITFYSENTFLMCTLLGFYFIYKSQPVT